MTTPRLSVAIAAMAPIQNAKQSGCQVKNQPNCGFSASIGTHSAQALRDGTNRTQALRVASL
jgi:hypothetical protein